MQRTELPPRETEQKPKAPEFIRACKTVEACIRQASGYHAIFAPNCRAALEWHAETGVTPIEGTELTGANGIETSRDGKTLYVAAIGDAAS